MELVSSFFENILVVEPEKDASETIAEAAPSQPKEVPTPTQESAPQSSEQPIQPEAPVYSSFWYLEDDPRKASNLLTEKLMEKVLNVVINTENQASGGIDDRLAIHRTRPPFSVNLMTTNCTNLAQKVSPVFEVVDGVILFFCWYNSVYTVGMLMVITHLILNPYLWATLPAVILLKRFLVPSYLKLYPPDPSAVDGVLWARNPVPHEGPPLRKYEPPKPCSQLSREFLMNFTDLQNQMVVYVRLYDAAVSWGQHYFLFENTSLSAVVFVLLVGSIVFDVTVLPYVVPVVLPYIPWKLLAIVLVWGSVGACHPVVRNKVLDRWHTEEARVARLNTTDRAENFLMGFIDETTPTEVVREVEIFELHRLSARKIWEPVGFTTDFYTLNHPQRILDAENAAKTTQESVEPKTPTARLTRRWSSAEIGKTRVERTRVEKTGAENTKVDPTTAKTTVDNSGVDNSGGDNTGGDNTRVEEENAAPSDAAPVDFEAMAEESMLEQDTLMAREAKEEEDIVLPILHKATMAEVQAPQNWQFASSAWHIDLDPQVWVHQNCIMDLVSVDTDEKWVYDFVDQGETPDAQVYRRRRWVRQCTREKMSVGMAAATAPSSRSSEWLSKTLSLA